MRDLKLKKYASAQLNINQSIRGPITDLPVTRAARCSRSACCSRVERGMARDEAYRISQELAQRAWDEQIPLRSLLEGDERAQGIDLDALLDYAPFVRHASEILARLEKIAEKRPPIALLASPHVSRGKRRPAPDREREGPGALRPR